MTAIQPHKEIVHSELHDSYLRVYHVHPPTKTYAEEVRDSVPASEQLAEDLRVQDMLSIDSAEAEKVVMMCKSGTIMSKLALYPQSEITDSIKCASLMCAVTTENAELLRFCCDIFKFPRSQGDRGRTNKHRVLEMIAELKCPPATKYKYFTFAHNIAFSRMPDLITPRIIVSTRNDDNAELMEYCMDYCDIEEMFRTRDLIDDAVSKGLCNIVKLYNRRFEYPRKRNINNFFGYSLVKYKPSLNMVKLLMSLGANFRTLGPKLVLSDAKLDYATDRWLHDTEHPTVLMILLEIQKATGDTSILQWFASQNYIEISKSDPNIISMVAQDTFLKDRVDSVYLFTNTDPIWYDTTTKQYHKRSEGNLSGDRRNPLLMLMEGMTDDEKQKLKELYGDDFYY